MLGSVIVIVLLQGCTVARAAEYYCPYGTELIGNACYRYHRNSETYEDANKICTGEGGSLPTQHHQQISGWLNRDKIRGGMLEEQHCVYAYPGTGAVWHYNISPCTRQLKRLCVKQSTATCGSAEYELEIGEEKTRHCASVSPDYVSGRDQACSADHRGFFSSHWPHSTTEELFDPYAVQTTKDFQQAFWTYWYLRQEPAPAVWIDQEHDSERGHVTFNVTDYCYHKLVRSVDVQVRDCRHTATFYCQTPAILIAPTYQDTTHFVFDKDKNYTCADAEDVLCNGRCYSHRNVYKTQEEAARNCTGSGYQLVSHNLTSCSRNGWIMGSLVGGNLIRNDTSLRPDDECVYIAGEAGLHHTGDCRRRARVLCQYGLGAAEAQCPAQYMKCGTGSQVCVGVSVNSYTWHEALGRGACQRTHFHVGAASIVDNRETVVACSTRIKELSSEEALWVGAKLNKNWNVSFINGDQVEIGDFTGQKKCLSVLGGQLRTAHCADRKYFTCEKLASLRDDKDDKDEGKVKSHTTTVMAILIPAPIVLAIVVLLLVYRKRGSDMCLSGADVVEEDEEEKAGGTVMMNMYAETVTIADKKSTNE